MKHNWEYKDKIQEIAGHYGAYPQSIQAVEEMAELTQALTKFWRYKGADADKLEELKENIFEELADVQIMLDQIAYLYIGESSVEGYINEKLRRQLKRIEKEKGGKIGD